MTILSIDTSGKTAGAALMRDGVLIGEVNIVTRLTHSQVILPMVERLLKDCETDMSEVDCVAAAKGPGSYTGLRIGIGAIKGMCLGDPALKCAGVSTLLALAYNLSAYDGRIFTVMKARGSICYFAAFDAREGYVLRVISDCLADMDEISEFIGEFKGKSMLIGDAAAELKEKYFKSIREIRLAPENSALPRAASICTAVERQSVLLCTPQELTVSYLQPTKAQKDRAHSKEK